MTLICVGLSHKHAPIAVREQLAVPAEQLGHRLQELRALAGVKEAMLVSTCNRLEIFAVADGRQPSEEILASLGAVAAPHAVCRFDVDALRHLFRVAASLDSMVVGEAQILGQVKEAAAQAQQAGAMGPELSRALARATAAARRVRTETEIARGAVSVSSVAVQLAHKLLGNLAKKSVLLLGAGEMAQLAARELRSAGARELLVANRSSQRAEELAREVGGVPVSLEELPALLERADVAICSTGASRFVVTREAMSRALRARRYRPIFLVDLTLPRNVEPSANQLENVYVYDLDDLERAAAQNRDLRSGQVGKAEEIVEQELQVFLAQVRERAAVPVLARLRAHAEAVARAEAEKTLTQLRGLDEKQQKSVRAMATAIVNKLLHAPTRKLREEAGEGALGDAAAALFELDSPGPQPVPIPLPDPQPDPAPNPEPDPAQAPETDGAAQSSERAVLPLLRRR
ncbi:MAG TPA: glutamyl-tRNA reductase [Myxococcales bacterium]|nr:glutamyl-tRNA reductase [Myxococcales bacterium]